MSGGATPTPTVTFRDNRHIIPKSFLVSSAAHTMLDLHHASLSDNTMTSTFMDKRPSSSPATSSNGHTETRPGLSDKHANSWGATTVNRKLRYEVFGEAFGQPVPIQRHKKPAQQRRGIAHRPGQSSHLRSSHSESNLMTLGQEPQPALAKPEFAEESMRKRAIKGAAEAHGPMPLPASLHKVNMQAIVEREIPMVDDGTEANFEEHAGTSAPEPDIAPQLQKPARKRRYSSGGLRRKPDEVAHGRGNLKYFEEADEAGYKGDGEDDLFAMDPEPSEHSKASSVTSEPAPKSVADVSEAGSTASSAENGMGTMLPAARDGVDMSGALSSRPVNPKEAQTQPDRRVEFFLLLEDLTAGMKRPCVMDLKMGTRQYGVDANEKKQQSQRRKCAETTSRELGVRVCGLQVWNVATQKYVFEDKYFGRNLKAGREFQDALARFLYNGVDDDSILHHIPTILKKIAQLEVLIHGLRAYRFYAASLLMFYDGEVEDGPVNEGENAGPQTKRRAREVDFKIADFANCITSEIVGLEEKACPPRHPDAPDGGFLRGLKSLRTYFVKIQKETLARSKGVNIMGAVARQHEDMGMGDANANANANDEGLTNGYEQIVVDDNDGDVSY
jgi:inositol-hexakisphosphate kinase